MKRPIHRKVFFLLGILVLGLALVASPWRIEIGSSVPGRSFDDVRRQVEGKNAAETLALLGEPDTRQQVFGGDIRFIWWRYAVLDGPDHAPELRGRVVHLQIVFRNPGRSAQQNPDAPWPMDEGLGVGFWLEGEPENHH